MMAKETEMDREEAIPYAEAMRREDWLKVELEQAQARVRVLEIEAARAATNMGNLWHSTIGLPASFHDAWRALEAVLAEVEPLWSRGCRPTGYGEGRAG